MDTQSVCEMEEAKLAPSENGQPSRMVQYDTSPDLDMGLREALERHVDQVGSQDSSPQDNLKSLDANQGASEVEGNKIFLGLSFPRKLWMIVEDDTFLSLHWNEAGDTIVIEQDLFQCEILCRRGEEKIFDSESLKSFIRLLNHHGFRKVRPGNSSVCSPGKKALIYVNNNFQRGKPWLLENIKTKGNQRTRASPESRSTPPKRNKTVAATRRSARIHCKIGDIADELEGQRRATNIWGPRAPTSFNFLVPWSRRCAMQVQGPSEAGGPSGEGTSENVMFVPPATAGNDGTGDLPIIPPNNPPQGSVMSLFDICYYTLMAELSEMVPPKGPGEDEEKEQGGFLDNYYSLCE